MSSTTTELIQRAAAQLFDEGGRHWDPDELLSYLNEAVQRLVELRPELFTRITTLELEDGCLQHLPDDGAQFLSLLDVDEHGVSRFDLSLMQRAHPGWQRDTPARPRQFAPDPADPRSFWVHPPVRSDHEARLEYVARPAPLEHGAALPVDARFDAALLDYMLGRAYSKDTEYAGQDARANFHFQRFEGMVNRG